MKSSFLHHIALLALLCAGATASANITLSTVTIGNPGNANDPTTDLGGVNYTYAIGKYDVTLTQYTAFLNAVAKTDTYGLYHPNMGTDLNIAGITRSGSSGSYSYAVIPGTGNRPVTYVSWFDAARFTNWLSNGQPVGLQVAGTTETGAYTLNGALLGVIMNNGTGSYWLPSESEWYKAAYYDPNKGGPGVGGYWTYATKSDTAPGNVVGGAANQANYYTGFYSVSQSNIYSGAQNYLTDVGAFTGSGSAYGTFDQNGNVFQWNDADLGGARGIRGGSWEDNASYLQTSGEASAVPNGEYDKIGFRIATVPEPTVGVSLILAGGLMLALRKRPSAI